MIGKIDSFNADKTQAKVKLLERRDENGDFIKTDFIQILYPVFNDDMQIYFELKINDMVHIFYDENGERFITGVLTFGRVTKKADLNEVGLFFQGSDSIKYNTVTRAINIESSGNVTIKGALIQLN